MRNRSLLSLLLLFAVASWAVPAAAKGSSVADPCPRILDRIASLEATRDFIARKDDTASWLARWLDPAIDRNLRKHADRCVRLNEVQVIGTHNSYHVQPRLALFAALVFFDPMFLSWEYTHRPLGEQFGELGIRQIELDVFRDPEGGLYSFRAGLTVVGDDPLSPLPEMYEPGLKTLHVQDLDFETRCPTFVQCLQDVKDWSDANPDHLPIFVLVELKDEAIPDPVDLGFVTPVPFDAASLDQVDAEIRSVFPDSQLLVPDDLRLRGRTLEASVLGAGWPLLKHVRGRVIFAMDNGGEDRLRYIEGRPSLEGRVLFTNGVPGEPDAAFVKRNDPVGGFDDIQDLVEAGYLVRTRADADTNEARTGDTSRRDLALESGAQFVSSDYPEPDPAFSDYEVSFPDGRPARCNPISAPQGCRDEGLSAPTR